MLVLRSLILNEQQEVSFNLAQTGLVYRAGVVRERPVDKFKPADLLQSVHAWRAVILLLMQDN